MKLDRVIAVRNNKTIYRDGDTCVKVFNADYSKADVLNEALNQSRIEETGLNIPKILEVTMVDGKWAIVSEFIKGKTLAQLIEEDPDNKDKYIGVWECKHSEPKDYSEYMYLYKDGTGEYYIVKKTFSYHYNAFSWDVEDGYLVISRSSETDIKYTLSGNKLIDKKGAVRWQKFGDDTTVVPLS